jgi:hypothetical protein
LYISTLKISRINHRISDACNFYGKLGVYESFGGVALAQEEGQNIAASLGKENSAVILQNHGYIALPNFSQAISKEGPQISLTLAND